MFGKILTITVAVCFCLSFIGADDSVNVVEEKVIKMSNPDWWQQVFVERPLKYKTEKEAWNQLNLIKREIDGRKKTTFSKEQWPKYQIKAYIFVAGTYKKNHALRAEAFCRVGELYRNLGDINRANTAYYNSIAQLQKVDESMRDKELLAFCYARVTEMENEINLSGSNVVLSEEK